MAESVTKACLITNPRSGRGDMDLSDVLPVLAEQGWHVTVRQKTRGGQATELAKQAAAEGCDVVVACGGDGTVSEIADGLVGTTVAVGVLPGGTVNLWARELGISMKPKQAAVQLVGAVRRRMDVGHVTINGRRGTHFVLMAGLGFDGAVISRVSKPLKNRIGALAVGLATLEAIPKFKPVAARVELDDTRWEGRAAQIVVGNTRKYGGFTSLTPNAYVDDGLLDVCLIAAGGALQAGRQLASLAFRGRPSPVSAASYRTVTMTVRTAEPLPLQLDGGAVRLKKKDQPMADGMVYAFSVVAQGLTVLVPRAYDGALFSRDAEQDAVLQGPVGAQSGGQSGKDQPGKRVMRVTSIGAASFTAARLRDDTGVTVLLDASTVLKNGNCHAQPAQEMLTALREGSVVKVKGKRDREHGTIEARTITILPADHAPGP
jgi:YegS/Rv2252/BmrU family lipid kinase